MFDMKTFIGIIENIFLCKDCDVDSVTLQNKTYGMRAKSLAI